MDEKKETEKKSKVIGEAEIIEEKEEDNIETKEDSISQEEDNIEIEEEKNNNLEEAETLDKKQVDGQEYTNYPDKTDKKDMKGLIILIVVLFVICILGILWIMLSKDKDNKVTKDKGASNVELKYTETLKDNEGTYLIDVSEVVENVMPSIVAITSKTLVTSGRYGPNFFGTEQYATGAGSGIIVSKTDSELMILTNNHVIEDAESLSVQFINDKSVDAQVKGSSSSKDVAIITVKLKDLDKETANAIKIATMGDSNKLKVGNGVIAIGNALGYGQSVTTGVISALNREVSVDNTTNNMIQIDAAINGGNSGGALLNSKGEVIGINSVKYSSNAYSNSASIEGMGFAIPISDVSDLITKLMNGENLTEKERGYLGVSGYMITSEYNEAYGIPEGFYISSIVEGSGADKAKLEIGNIITEIDGMKVEQFSTISEVLETKKANEKVKLKVKYINGREYKEKEINVTLSSYKDVN